MKPMYSPRLTMGQSVPYRIRVPGAGAGQPAFQQSGVARLLLKIAVQLHPALQQAGQVRADVGVLPQNGGGLLEEGVPEVAHDEPGAGWSAAASSRARGWLYFKWARA